jgi:hypothetical protein
MYGIQILTLQGNVFPRIDVFEPKTMLIILGFIFTFYLV